MPHANTSRYTNVYANSVLYQSIEQIQQDMLYVPVSMRFNLTQWQHALNDKSHFGEQKTLFLLKELFFWPGMDAQVKDIIGSCDVCLSLKLNQKTINPELNLFEHTNRPFERIVIDLLGPLPLTTRRNRYVGVIVDSYSRYVIAFPMKNKTAEEFAAKFHANVICIHRAPANIHSDRGSEFIAYSTSDRDTNVPTTRSTLIQGILQTHDALKEHLEKHNAEQDQKVKNYYNQHKRTPNLKVGNIVFVREMIPQGKFKKFAQKFIGTYIITELQDHQRVLLNICIRIKTIHIHCTCQD